MKIKEQGLYSPEFEHENCGAGFICNLKGEKTNQIIHDALEILVKLEHRGGVSSDGKTGDGAGLLIDIPHEYFNRVCNFTIPNAREYAVGMVFLPKTEKDQGQIVGNKFANWLLLNLVIFENKLLKFINFPFGVSTFCIVKKEDK